MKKNQLNQLKFWKNRSVRFSFGFLSLEPEKPNRIEPNWKKPEKNRAKLKKSSQTRKNQAKPVFTLKNQIEPKPVGLNWFWFGFLKKFNLIIFLIKTKPNSTNRLTSLEKIICLRKLKHKRLRKEKKSKEKEKMV